VSPLATLVESPTTVEDPVPAGVHGGMTGVRDRLVDGVAAAVGDLATGALVEVSLPLLRRAGSRPETLGQPEDPFSWKPAFARRSLGLAAVGACAGGRFRAPAEAVGPLADHAVDEWRRTGWRTFHWEPWFAGLGAGARAMVLAEATTWASHLWASADWGALGARARIGGADDLWTCPGPRTVRLKGRCEARVAPPAGGSGPVLVSVSCGNPSDRWEEELGYLALVAALRSPDQPVPVRVAGLWPDAGMRRTVDVDDALLSASAERVVGAVALVARARVTAGSDPV